VATKADRRVGSLRMSEWTEFAGNKLNLILTELSLQPLEQSQADAFREYLSLLLRWNSRMNLTAIRDEEGILRRHFVESILCARLIPSGINTLLDFGSGAGFPGIPIAICRPEISVTLAESQGKKAAFLNEALRVLAIAAKVHSGKAEELGSGFDCVTLRAVDKMQAAVQSATQLIRPGGSMALMTTGREVEKLKEAAGRAFTWMVPVALPGGEDRILALGSRAISSPA